MNSWLNYHHLFYFKTIAEEGGVSKAAKKLRLGQPTLSAQLKSLEEQLGFPLFERAGRELVLTEQGKVALDYAQAIFKTGMEMTEVLQDRGKLSKTHLHVGTIDSIPKQVTSELVGLALATADCRISLSEGRQDLLLTELKAFRMDLIITNLLPNGSHSKGVFSRSIYREEVSVFGSARFKRLRKNFPDSLSNAPFILPTYDSRLRQDLDQWAESSGISPDIVVESQDIAVNKMLAIQGVGLIPAAPASVAHQVRGGELRKIGVLHGVTEEFFILKAHRKIENPVAKAIFRKFSVSQ
jgi:LysR family transcriptional activator of nhaA